MSLWQQKFSFLSPANKSRKSIILKLASRMHKNAFLGVILLNFPAGCPRTLLEWSCLRHFPWSWFVASHDCDEIFSRPSEIFCVLHWLHHNHKISVGYHKNGLVSSHQSIGRWFIFMCFVLKIFWWNQLAINSLVVSVSRWNSWLEQFRFHVNYIHFQRAVFVHAGLEQLCTGKGVWFYMCSAVEVAWLAQNIRRSSSLHVCNCIYSGVRVYLVNNNAKSYLTIFTSLCWVW